MFYVLFVFVRDMKIIHVEIVIGTNLFGDMRVVLMSYLYYFSVIICEK